MDTIFSDYQITATRLATLLTSPSDEHEQILARWYQDDLRSALRLNFYGPTRKTIEALHRRDISVHQARVQADDWRLEALANAQSRERLNHNARATDQYLDHHGERQLVVLNRQHLETTVGRVRVTASPHLYVLCGAAPTRLWLDCTETFDEPRLIAKCYVTLWLERRMGAPPSETEVIHSAQGRIVARGRIPPSFDSVVVAILETVRRTWKHLGGRTVST